MVEMGDDEVNDDEDEEATLVYLGLDEDNDDEDDVVNEASAE